MFVPGIVFAIKPGERGFCAARLPCPSLGVRERRYFFTSSRAIRLLTVESAASFMAVAFATMSAWDAGSWLKEGTIGVLVMEAQLPLPALYGDSTGKSSVLWSCVLPV